MRFNVCNPCCTALPAWTVIHKEVPKGIHVIQVAFSLRAYKDDGESKYCHYLSYLFYNSSYVDEEGNQYWVFKNCEEVEGRVRARMVVKLVDKIANARCEEQTWLQPVSVEEFEYKDPESTEGSDDYSEFKLEFSAGSFVSTCCHLFNIRGDNYLDLSGSLQLNDNWKVKGFNKDNSKINPEAWFTTILVPRVGTLSYSEAFCTDPSSGIPSPAQLDSPIGEFSFGAANEGKYWMVSNHRLGATTYDHSSVSPEGYYLNRWSLNVFGVACNTATSSSTGGGFINNECRSLSSIVAGTSSSIQTNPIYLDAACGYAYYTDNGETLSYNYWPWQYNWGSTSGYNPSDFDSGSWNYGWWFNYCARGDSGSYNVLGFDWRWGGPYYAQGLGYSYWNWWGAYPCYSYVSSIPNCWLWSYGNPGWWGYVGWWWYGGTSGPNYLGDLIGAGTDEAFSAWHEQLEGLGYSNGTCYMYSTCDKLYTNPEKLPCSLTGVSPIRLSLDVRYAGRTGRISMSGNVNLSGASTFGETTFFKGCGGGVTFTGSLTMTGMVVGTMDISFTSGSGYTQSALDPSTMTFFGSGIYTDPVNGNQFQIQLNGSITNKTLGVICRDSAGTIESGSMVLTPVMNPTDPYVELTGGAMDLSNVQLMTINSTIQGSQNTRHPELEYRMLNCNNNVECVPRKPVLGIANLFQYDVTYTSIFRTEPSVIGGVQCFLIDVIADKRTYCFGLAYYNPTTDRHALDELYGFERVPNPPINYYEELPWDDNPCAGEVLLSQQAVLASDVCVPEEE